MSEKLEEKYKYMCELVEDQAREIFEYTKIIDGAQNKEQELYREKELLKDHIFGMCEMIYYQVPLKESDSWMDTMIEQGYYKKPEDD